MGAFDVVMSDGIRKSFKRAIKTALEQMHTYEGDIEPDILTEFEVKRMSFNLCRYSDDTNKTWEEDRNSSIQEIKNVTGKDQKCAETAYNIACKMVREETHQAMEAFLFNMNTLHSRSGSQTVFSSINYGMDTTPEGRLITREMLNVTDAGMGHGETSIFPIQIFTLLKGINYDPEDTNYDLFQQAIKVSARRLYPNFNSQGASFNIQYYDPKDYRTYAATMGCRTRVISNVNGEETFTSRGNFAFATINLPKIAIEAKGDIQKFFKIFDKYIRICKRYLEYRYEIIARKKVKNFPFVMGQGLYMGSENLGPEDEIRPAIKNASLSIGFIGLAEALILLTGKHHGESEEAQELGIQIVGYLRDMTDKFSKQTHMNWSTFATPAEGYAGKALKILRKQYGIIPGVTDHAFLTNSFHVPVYYECCAGKKIRVEAPYHTLCNAGAISYIEMDGDPLNNLEAFESVVRAMYTADMGYFAISHANDHDPVCGYTGIIKDECPHCHRKETTVHNLGRIKRGLN